MEGGRERGEEGGTSEERRGEGRKGVDVEMEEGNLIPRLSPLAYIYERTIILARDL